MEKLQIVNATISGGLAMLGGIANYFYSIDRQSKIFRFSKFFIHAGLAFFVGLIAEDFIPEDQENKSGLIMLCGYMCLSILDFVEKHFINFIQKGKFNG